MIWIQAGQLGSLIGRETCCFRGESLMFLMALGRNRKANLSSTTNEPQLRKCKSTGCFSVLGEDRCRSLATGNSRSSHRRPVARQAETCSLRKIDPLTRSAHFVLCIGVDGGVVHLLPRRSSHHRDESAPVSASLAKQFTPYLYKCKLRPATRRRKWGFYRRRQDLR